MQSIEQNIMSSDDLQALREYIEQYLPWLVILGIVGEQPLLAVINADVITRRFRAEMAAF